MRVPLDLLITKSALYWPSVPPSFSRLDRGLRLDTRGSLQEPRRKGTLERSVSIAGKEPPELNSVGRLRLCSLQGHWLASQQHEATRLSRDFISPLRNHIISSYQLR